LPKRVALASEDTASMTSPIWRALADLHLPVASRRYRRTSLEVTVVIITSNETTYIYIILAGVFWKRDPPPLAAAPPPQPTLTPTPSLPSRRIMSRTPEQPGLTPQFCFNQTALRGEAPDLLIITIRLTLMRKNPRLPPRLPDRSRRHHQPKPERPHHTRRTTFRSIIDTGPPATTYRTKADRWRSLRRVQRPRPLP
jgi:hypothetical protein